MAKFTFDVNFTRKEFRKSILIPLSLALNRASRKVVTAVDPKIRGRVIAVLESSPFYRDVVGGRLKGEFGIPEGEALQRMEAIVSVIARSVRVTARPFKVIGDNIDGGIEVFIQEDDFRNILEMPESYINTEDGVLPWMQWVLLEGDRIIISGHKVRFKQGGRSGIAIMVNTKSGHWRVPPEHSGTIDDNWITRALFGRPLHSVIGFLIEQEFKKYLK